MAGLPVLQVGSLMENKKMKSRCDQTLWKDNHWHKIARLSCDKYVSSDLRKIIKGGEVKERDADEVSHAELREQGSKRKLEVEQLFISRAERNRQTTIKTQCQH